MKNVSRFIIVFIIANAAIFSLIILGNCGKSRTQKTEYEATYVDSTEKQLQVLTKRIAEDPNDPSLLYQRSLIYYRLQNLYKGLEDIIRAISIDSSEVKYHLLLADFYYADNRIGEARECIEKGLKLNPDDVNANIRMGELMYYLTDYVQMFSHLDVALKQDPYNAKIYFIKGMGFKEMGDTNLAISSFSTTIEQDPDYFDAYMQLANIYAAKHNPIAIQYYNNAIQINPLMIEAHYGLAYYLQENGKPDDAIKIYTDLLSIDPTNAVACHNIGYIFLFFKNDPTAAIQWFNRSASLNPKVANTYYHRGYAYEVLKDYVKARENYNLALEIAEGNFPLASQRLEQILNK